MADAGAIDNGRRKTAGEAELRIRRIWAEKIRQEFGKYHEHSSEGECGACGAIQAANFMDPDKGEY